MFDFSSGPRTHLLDEKGKTIDIAVNHPIGDSVAIFIYAVSHAEVPKVHPSHDNDMTNLSQEFFDERLERAGFNPNEVEDRISRRILEGFFVPNSVYSSIQINYNSV